MLRVGRARPSAPAAEPARTARLLAATSCGAAQLQALARLWAVPRAALDAYAAAAAPRTPDWASFYERVVRAGDMSVAVGGGHAPDARLFRILRAIAIEQEAHDAAAVDAAAEQPKHELVEVEEVREAAEAHDAREPPREDEEVLDQARGEVQDPGQAAARQEELRASAVRAEVVSTVVAAALTRRGSPLFLNNMAAALATVHFFISPDRLSAVYSPAALRRSGLCAALRRFEVSNEMVGCLSGLESSRFVAMLRDLADVLDDSRSRERAGFGPCLCAGKGAARCGAGWVSVGAVLRYVERRDLLTRRAVVAVCKRHGRHEVVDRADCVAKAEAEARARAEAAARARATAAAASKARTLKTRPRAAALRRVAGPAPSVGSVGSSVSAGSGRRRDSSSDVAAADPAADTSPRPIPSVSSLVTMDCEEDAFGSGHRSPPSGNDESADGASDADACSLAEMDYEDELEDDEEEDDDEVDEDADAEVSENDEEDADAERAVSAYTRSSSLVTGAIDALSGLDFLRLYLALVHCGTDGGVMYWFDVLDIDGDGYISCADARHFYSERRREGERRLGGTSLCDVESVWTRVCASAGGREGGPGDLTCRLSARDVLRMGKCDREFLLCALLIRRVDDVQLVDVAATERLRQSEAFKMGAEL